MELADTSAWWWSARAEVALRQGFDEAVVAGRIATCDIVRLELLHRARNLDEFRPRAAVSPTYPAAPSGSTNGALDVYETLAGQDGMHQRAVKHKDLLIAAAAESASVVLLHYDQDFDRISAITGQPTRWLAPKGTL